MKHTPFAFALTLLTLPLYADEITLTPTQDTTLYSENDLANGLGQNLFSAVTNGGNVRRALLGFDVASSIPAGATITSANLALTVNKVPRGAAPGEFGLHVLSQAWAEGSVDAGGQEGRGAASGADDATWNSTGFTTWNAPGGDFVEAASAVAEVGLSGQFDWSSDALVSDVQAWLDQPTMDFGWALIGDELSSLTAKRFASSNHANASLHPALTIEFDLDVAPVLGDFDGNGELLASDINLLCGAINSGENPGFFDLNGSGVVDLDDLNVWVEDLAGTFLGDSDLNGNVDFTDFLVLSSRFPGDGEGWATADFDCNGAIGFPDFLILSANFGRTPEGASGTLSSVPEPSACGLLGLAMVVAVLGPRKSRRR